MKEDVLRVKDVVARVLEQDSRARNDDKWLILQALKAMGYRVYIPYASLKDMPSFESITRTRRKIQSDGTHQAEGGVLLGRDEERAKMKDLNRWF